MKKQTVATLKAKLEELGAKKTGSKATKRTFW